MTGKKQIILFDGVCNLCNGAVQFIIARDSEDIFKFTSLQSEVGKKLLAQHDLPIDQMDTIVLIQNEQAFSHSTAGLKIANQLKGFKYWTMIFWLIPRPIRNIVYSWISRNRYKWFGKEESCMLPRKEWASKFI